MLGWSWPPESWYLKTVAPTFCVSLGSLTVPSPHSVCFPFTLLVAMELSDSDRLEAALSPRLCQPFTALVPPLLFHSSHAIGHWYRAQEWSQPMHALCSLHSWEQGAVVQSCHSLPTRFRLRKSQVALSQSTGNMVGGLVLFHSLLSQLPLWSLMLSSLEVPVSHSGTQKQWQTVALWKENSFWVTWCARKICNWVATSF